MQLPNRLAPDMDCAIPTILRTRHSASRVQKGPVNRSESGQNDQHTHAVTVRVLFPTILRPKERFHSVQVGKFRRGA